MLGNLLSAASSFLGGSGGGSDAALSPDNVATRNGNLNLNFGGRVIGRGNKVDANQSATSTPDAPQGVAGDSAMANNATASALQNPPPYAILAAVGVGVLLLVLVLIRRK